MRCVTAALLLAWSSPGFCQLKPAIYGQGGANTIGTFRQGKLTSWYLDSNGDHTWDTGDTTAWFGVSGDYPIMGDWGNGILQMGIFRGAAGYWIVDSNNNGQYDSTDQIYAFGLPNDIPVVGDWDGTGVLRIGVFRVPVTPGQAFWIVKSAGCVSNTACNFEGTQNVDWYQFQFGLNGDIPVVGDWDGTGVLRIGVFRPGTGWIVNMITPSTCQYNNPLQNPNNLPYVVFCNQWGQQSATQALPVPYPLLTVTAAAQPTLGDWTGTGTGPLHVGTLTPAGTLTNWNVDLNVQEVWNSASPEVNWFSSDEVFAGYGLVGDAPVVGPWSKIPLSTGVPTAYQLTTVANPAQGGTIAPATGSYDSAVRITATPNSGYQFSGFTGSGNLNVQTNPLYLTITGTTTVTANFSQSSTLTVTTASPLPGAVSQTPYSQGLAASGGVPPYGWSLYSGSLPAGLSLNRSTGVISGTPTSDGVSNFTVEVIDSGNNTASKTLALTVAPALVITAGPPPPGAPNEPYSPWTLSASGGTPPYAWQVQFGSFLPPGLSVNGGFVTGTPSTAGTYNFTMQVADSGGQFATMGFQLAVIAPLTLPPLKGVQYFPRGHAWWSMLTDWSSYDCATSTLGSSDCQSNTLVSTIVQTDLQTLHNSGFNFIHLYIWDEDLVQDIFQGKGFYQSSIVTCETCWPGFAGWDDGLNPQNSEDNQWGALKEFVSMAQALGIWVEIDFAASRFVKEVETIEQMNPTTVGGYYGSWVGQFVSALATYHNVLIWGLDWNMAGDNPSDSYLATTNSTWAAFWTAAYSAALQAVLANPYPQGHALLAMDSYFGHPENGGVGGISPINHGYTYNWDTTQQYAYNFKAATGYTPDRWLLFVYGPNVEDINANLQCLADTPSSSNPLCTTSSNPRSNCGTGGNQACPTTPTTTGCGNGPCNAIPTSDLVVREWVMSSGVTSGPLSAPWYGDQETPVGTTAGQSQWLADTLCAISGLGIPAYSWYGLYDSASWWPTNYPGITPLEITWDGYFGLIPEPLGSSPKPAFSALQYGSSCPTPSTPALAFWTDAAPYLYNYNSGTGSAQGTPYYTVNDLANLNYTAADVTSLGLSVPFDNSDLLRPC
ncbi:MAG: putative Ig domain-containing protein [Bryobacteraceae bacterium]